MDASALAQRVARVRRAVERAASETASEARQTALETLAHFARELAEHFAAEDASLPPGSLRHAQHARLRGDLREIDERARAAGDWPESWRSVAAAFDRFGVALEQHERTETT